MTLPTVSLVKFSPSRIRRLILNFFVLCCVTLNLFSRSRSQQTINKLGDTSALTVQHTGLEALPSKKKWSIDWTGVPGFLRPVRLWDRVAKPEKMGKKLNFVKKLVKNTSIGQSLSRTFL